MEMTYNYAVQTTGLPVPKKLKLGVYCNKGELLDTEVTIDKDAFLMSSLEESTVRVFKTVEEKIERCSNHNDRYHATIKNADTDDVIMFIHISTMFERTYKANSIGEVFRNVLSGNKEV